MSDIHFWTAIFIVLSFTVYLYIAWRSRVKETAGFYLAGQGIPTVANGAAVAADWMSAASFISMAGLIAFLGYDGAIYLMGGRAATCCSPCCWPPTCACGASSRSRSSSVTGTASWCAPSRRAPPS